ncbi:F0F1 ATP synthase subunit delta [Wenzhouxiangella limi]|uniref:ATP synthase subunit delta n=1 Tax=Wenzhouxiangella limi TaxID=2707351 RepID=A0A845UUL4_9GAMM|nr:F0F1 ATP synthase subunit delta [Wenzhouxiangella limi]NDY94228.1 F0F1 ATP synthase subunit delta [Wenzhouxiangella limi]
MLNRTTLARPYARAAFQSARAHDSVQTWGHNLAVAAQVASEEPMPALLENPRLTKAQILDVFREAGGEALDDRFLNFLKTLSQYRRLALLPDVYVQFEALRREAEERVHVLVTSAHAMSEEQARRLSERLRQRFEREIDLEVEVDASLIGGAVIRARDQVIDGSVRGQLKRLARQVAA